MEILEKKKTLIEEIINLYSELLYKSKIIQKNEILMFIRKQNIFLNIENKIEELEEIKLCLKRILKKSNSKYINFNFDGMGYTLYNLLWEGKINKILEIEKIFNKAWSKKVEERTECAKWWLIKINKKLTIVN